MARDAWTDAENDLVVADYFAMLADDFAGRDYNKSAQRRRILPHLNGRSEGSVEFKRQNISAVLKALGEDWIAGYKPAFNFQMSLVDAVMRWLERNPAWIVRGRAMNVPHQVSEDPGLWIAPPPTRSNEPPPEELEQMLAIARRYDAAERDARNRALGEAGEALILEHERIALTGNGRADLARQIRWVSKEDGDGAGYDIASFERDGRERLIEVKTTNGWERTPFHITRNELATAEAHSDAWRIVRIWNFSRQPRAFELRPPLTDHVTLLATAYQARFD